MDREGENSPMRNVINRMHEDRRIDQQIRNSLKEPPRKSILDSPLIRPSVKLLKDLPKKWEEPPVSIIETSNIELPKWTIHE